MCQKQRKTNADISGKYGDGRSDNNLQSLWLTNNKFMQKCIHCGKYAIKSHHDFVHLIIHRLANVQITIINILIVIFVCFLNFVEYFFVVWQQLGQVLTTWMTLINSCRKIGNTMAVEIELSENIPVKIYDILQQTVDSCSVFGLLKDITLNVDSIITEKKLLYYSLVNFTWVWKIASHKSSLFSFFVCCCC